MEARIAPGVGTASTATFQIRQLLLGLIGTGFSVSITVDESTFTGLKVVVLVDDLVYTVTAAGEVNVFPLPAIRRVDY